MTQLMLVLAVSTNIGMLQRGLAWPLHIDNTSLYRMCWEWLKLELDHTFRAGARLISRARSS